MATSKNTPRKARNTAKHRPKDPDISLFDRIELRRDAERAREWSDWDFDRDRDWD
jgi:hypothetical protein